MNGVVHVVKDPGHVQTIKNVGSGLSESGVGYDVKYILDKSLQQTVTIDSTAKTVTFRVVGDTENEQIVLTLPSEIIENPNTAWVDGIQTEFSSEDTSSGKKLVIPITPHSKEIKIMGTHVIPEFGFLSLVVLSISILLVVVIARYKFPAKNSLQL